MLHPYKLPPQISPVLATNTPADRIQWGYSMELILTHCPIGEVVNLEIAISYRMTLWVRIWNEYAVTYVHVCVWYLSWDMLPFHARDNLLSLTSRDVAFGLKFIINTIFNASLPTLDYVYVISDNWPNIITSWHQNTFHITWEKKPQVNSGFPLQMASNVEHWCFFCWYAMGFFFLSKHRGVFPCLDLM